MRRTVRLAAQPEYGRRPRSGSAPARRTIPAPRTLRAPGPAAALRYHPPTLRRFLLIAFPLLLLLIALFNLGAEVFGVATGMGPLVGWKPGQAGVPGAYVLGTWALEAVALTALFLLIDGRGGWYLTNALAAVWIAWVFRGPLLVLTAAGAGGSATTDWWPLAWRWFGLYTAAGIILAITARLTGLRRLRPRPKPPEASAEPTP